MLYKGAWTVLHFAANRGDEAIVKCLIAQQADLEAKDNVSDVIMYVARVVEEWFSIQW